MTPPSISLRDSTVDLNDPATVLIVDDDAMLLEALSMLLEEHWPVLTADSVPRARELLQEHDVAVIVTDDRMPGESGVDLLAWAYRHSPGTMRILITGYADADQIVRSINDGHIWHYIRKPCNNQELINLVERALEYRESQLAVRRSERRYRELFHHAQIGIVRLAPSGWILEANQSLAISLGFTDPEELIDTDLSSLCIDPEGWNDLRNQILSERSVDNIELVLRHRQSQPVFMLVNASMRVTTSGERVIEASMLDYTQNRLAVEENLSLKKQLRRVQRHETVGSLSCGIAHDFNNQMTVVLSSASFAATLVEAAKGDLAECLADILTASRHASELSRQLMTFVRQDDAGPQPVDINRTIEQTVRLLSRTLVADIRIEQRLMDDLPQVSGDGAQLHQCFLNLCLNACQAMEHGGVLCIETSTAKSTSTEKGEAELWVETRVTDTGVGMSDDVIAHIFDPFYTTKESGKGTGLGLSMVKAIVKQHGGTLSVESTVGEGSSFCVRLPSQRLTARHEHSSPIPLLRSTRGMVLLADDDPAIRKATGRTLEQMGFTVLRASNGKEAVMFVEENPELRLAFLDAVMPVMSGEEAFRHIRRIRPELPVLFTTGYVVTRQLQKSLIDSKVSLINKPFDAEELAREVYSLLEE